ncbi:asparagine synthetase B [Tateyamaria omphalii]|nr:asparagine synthetase B [Tateyamaria omphalii]
MTATLGHRGPDGAGVWSSDDGTVSLGHRRLSVVDLDDRASQPMKDASGRYVISFNGEVYNFRTLRKELSGAGYAMSTQSDTEVLIEAFANWGVRRTLDRIQGMFAFAVWDDVAKVFYLCRDRFGIKPCYWRFDSGVFSFGSEMKALFACAENPLPLNPAAIAHLLDFDYVPSPDSVFQGIQQLAPGELLIMKRGEPPTVSPYWSLETERKNRTGLLAERSDAELLDECDTLLNQVIEEYLDCDVPTGCFLSGGIDSSLISAIASRKLQSPLRTFSIGFSEASWDESGRARKIASYIGTKHEELILTARMAQDLVEAIPDYYDVPFADFSQLPTLAVSRLARNEVTVCLSGDGGDELFAGYDRYDWSQRIWALHRALPGPVYKGLNALCSSRFMRSVRSALPPHVSETVRRLPEFALNGAAPATFDDYYKTIMRNHPSCLHEGTATESLASTVPYWIEGAGLERLDSMQIADIRHYMGDGILTKVDRASMSVGLEVRIPFLNERMVDFAFSLPMRSRHSKSGLRSLEKQLAYRYIPKALLDSPKMGFGFPVDSWLRAELRDWAEDLLSHSRLKQLPYINAGKVRKLWDQHISGTVDRHWQLWPVLIYSQWMQRWKTHIAMP